MAEPAAAGGNHSNKDKNRTPQIATAAFIVKGAAAKVLGTVLTIGTKFDNPKRGRLTVEYKGEKAPSDAERASIEEAANKKVKENLFVEVTEMDRAAAEAQFTKEHVNGQFIYEKKQPPAALTKLNVLVIADWTVGCVPSSDFTKKTAEVGGIKVTKFNHRPQKSELEIVYEVGDEVAPASGNAAAASGSGSAKTTAAAPTLILPRSDYDNVEFVQDKIEKLYFEAFSKSGGAKLDGTQLESLRTQVHHVLATFKNAAYANGFKSKITK